MSTFTTNQLPKTHRVLKLNSTRDPYDMAVVSQPCPPAGAGSAVIQVLASCVLTYSGLVYSGHKPYPYPTPFVPGLTAIGRIRAVGSDATYLKPGQLVYFDCFIQGRDNPGSLILHGLSAGFNTASNKLMEDEWRDSTYAEYAKVPLENCFSLNESLLMGDPAGGGMGYTAVDLMYLAQISVPFGGLQDVDLKVGETVVIAPAAGVFGSAAVVAALAMGAKVIAMGRNIETLGKLKSLTPHSDRLRSVCNTGDVEADIKEITKHGPVDVFFDISPGKAIASTHFKSCIMSLRRGGRVSLMGAHAELVLPTQFIMLNDITIKGKWMYTKDDIRKMISLTESGYIKLGQGGNIETVGTFGLEEFEKAFDTAARMRGPCLQTVITP